MGGRYLWFTRYTISIPPSSKTHLHFHPIPQYSKSIAQKAQDLFQPFWSDLERHAKAAFPLAIDPKAIQVELHRRHFVQLTLFASSDTKSINAFLGFALLSARWNNFDPSWGLFFKMFFSGWHDIGVTPPVTLSLTSQVFHVMSCFHHLWLLQLCCKKTIISINRNFRILTNNPLITMSESHYNFAKHESLFTCTCYRTFHPT